MVLIIGLINLAGPQTPVAEAQIAPRLTGLELSHAIVENAEDSAYRNVSLRQSFAPTRTSYTATVENGVVTLRVTPTYNLTTEVVDIGDGNATTTLSDENTTFANVAFGTGSSKKVIIVVSEDADNDGNADANAKSTTYTITATEKKLDIGTATAHLDGLAVNTINNDDTASVGSAIEGLRRYTKEGFDGFNAQITSYYITVGHDNQWVQVAANPGQYDGPDAGTEEDTDYTAVISPDDAGDSTATDDSATTTVKLGSGAKKTVTITVTGPGTKNTYRLTIERPKPTLASLNVQATGVDGQSAGEEINALAMDLKVSVPYESATSTVNPEDSDLDSSDGAGKVITFTNKKDNDTDANNGIQLKLRPGDTTVTLKVERYLRLPGQTSTAVGNTSTATYNLVITRSAPVLDSVSIEDGGTIAMDPTAFAAATTEYAVEVAFDVGRLTLKHAPGLKPNIETAPLIVTYDPKTDKSTDVGHQVDLKPGKNTIKVTVKSPLVSTSKTTYTFTVTRAETKLTGLSATCQGGAECSGSPLPLVPDGTTTPMASVTSYLAETMKYSATTSYAGNEVTVTAEHSDTDANVMFTSPISTTSPLTRDLRVGNNLFTIDVGTEVAGPANTSTYTLTVKRDVPAPTIQFKLYDKNGDEIDLPDNARLPLDLVSAARRYTRGKTDGFSVNVHSVRMNAYLGDGVEGENVKVSVGRVSIPVASELDDFDNYHTMDLAEGTNTMAFEVEYREHPKDQSLSGRSVHTLTISREGNSRPTFRPNHGLGQTLIEMVDEVEVDTSTTALPHALDGNDDLVYTLYGKGSADELPEGLEMVPPTGRTADGWIQGAPNIEGRTEYAEHTLILKVVDSDDITTNDHDTVEFTIRIYRDEEARRKAHAPTAVGSAQLVNLGVFYDDPSPKETRSRVNCPKVTLDMRRTDSSKRTDCGLLMPKFDPATMTYNVTVPTDVDTVDIHAISKASGQTLTLRGPGSPELGAGSNIYDHVSGKRHEWNGYRVLNGGAAQTDNIYILKVTEGTDQNEYRLTIKRETDTPAKFSAADKAKSYSFRFYEGIDPDGTAGNTITFPAAMADSGNGTTTNWVYSLDRTDTGDEVKKKNFEGLMLNAGTRKLEGTPLLDTDASARLSDKSGAPGAYTVTDADLNTKASDGDSIPVDITVYRDVTLQSFTVGDTTVHSLGLKSTEINSAWSAGDLNDDYSDWVYTWDANDDSGAIMVDAYTFPVAHDATVATFSAVARSSAKGATISSIKPDDADTSVAGHQVSLSTGDPGSGNNVVTVTVTNGDVQATHKINLVRPGQQASNITVTTDRGTKTGADDDVDLVRPNGKKGFDRDTYTYTATVESWIETLRISAVAIDPAATVSVNLDAINTAVGFAEVRLNEPQGSEDSTTMFRIGISNPTVTKAPGLYMLTVTRKGNDVPKFAATQADVLVKNGEAMSLKLPKASGGNGAVTHNLTEAELPNGVKYDAGTRTISGTPQLTVDQGYESDFVLTYTAVDSDSDTSAADSDSQTFTLTVTNGDVPAEPAPPGLGPDENYNTLRSLVVSYNRPGKADQIANLVPEFTSDNSGPYTAIVPHDAENVYVTPSLSDAGAALWIDNISQQNARKVKILSTTTIMVEHTTHPDLGAMTYTVGLSPTSDSVPSFAGKSIDDMVLLAGEDMGVTQLPMADGGNGTVSYTLKDHGGRDIPRRGIGGIKFDASSQTLSGTPVLNADADKTIYRLSYQATDQDGDASEVLGFMVTVCRSEDMPGCDITGNPGYTPADLVVRRAGNTATLTWTPGDDATMQYVGGIIINPTTGSIASTIRFAEVDGNARRHTFTDLADASVGTYVFGVWGSSPAGYEGWKYHSGWAFE